MNITALTSESTPEIGMLATINSYSDCKPAEVIDILKNGKEIKLRLMDYKLVKGKIPYPIEYEYISNPNLPVLTYTLRKNGRYIRKGEPLRSGTPCSLGFARYYYDLHF